MHWLVVGTGAVWLAGPPASASDPRGPSALIEVAREPDAPPASPPPPAAPEPAPPRAAAPSAIDSIPEPAAPGASEPSTDSSGPSPAAPGASRPSPARSGTASTPSPDLPPGTAPTPDPLLQRSARPHRIGRLPGYLGLGAGVGLTTRTVGGADRLTAVTAYGAVHGRLAGYAQRKGRHAHRVVVMILPEVQLDLELGGTAARSPAARGFMAGTSGVLDIGVGFASPGSVGVYTYLRAAQRFQARLHTDLEGAYLLASPGATAGLRVNYHHKLTLLAGGGVDGVIGPQRLLGRTALVAQLAPVAALSIYSEPNDDLYVGVLGRFDATVLGHEHGGARMHGRATFEAMWRVRKIPRIHLATLFLGYEGTRISAAPGHPQFDPLGERRTSHQFLLALGASF